MIQDLPKGLYHNEYRPLPPTAEDRVFWFRDGTVLAREGAELAFPCAEEFPKGTQLQYLFRLERGYYLLQGEGICPPGCRWRKVGDFRSSLPRREAFALITGYHLGNWYAKNRFCGRCGQLMQPDERERMLACPVCGNQVFPTISPAVIVGVVHQDRILLTRYAGRPGPAQALVAGFCEIGETLEDTVRREVWEEVGLKVDRIQYYKSQPWGLSASLLSGFYAELSGSDAICLQEDELGEAVWVEREQLDVPDDGVSLTREMIAHMKAQGNPFLCK